MAARGSSAPRARAAATATIAAVAALVVSAAPALAGVPAPPGTATTAQRPTATVVSTQRLDPRLRELTVRTPALASETRVRVLLPAGYERSRHRRYPVLYLLHGASGDYTNWTAAGEAEAATAGRPLIVVMPDGGRAGWYTDWHNGGHGGAPAWETYHVEQLIPLVDRRYRTVAKRRGRAIAGLSMGGFGALSYAARHPDLFTAAASYSGGIDLNAELFGQPIGRIAVDGSLSLNGFRGVTGATLFGDFATENIRWRGHNPPDLAANLRGVKVAIYTGNGEPGGPFGPASIDIIEVGAHAMSVNMHERLERLGIPGVFDDYGPGGHTFAYWRRDLRETLPWLMRRFAHPRSPPWHPTFTAIESAYSVFGWRVRLRRPNVEFSTLGDAGKRGFALTGSGSARVTTPPRYRPGARYRLRIKGRGRTRHRRVVAGRSGRLRIPVRLAPVNRYDAGSPQAEALGPPHRATARVRIARRDR